MNRDLILAIDHGTQSVRALIFDCRGNLKAKSQVSIKSYLSPSPGFSEQDPNYFWKAVCQACQKLFNDSKVYKESLAGVALTTQRSTIINVDEKGVPLRPAITWMDQRRTSGLKPVGGLWGLLFRLSGMTGTVSYLQAEAEGNWIQTYQPDIWAKTHKYLLLSGFLTFRLIGEYKDSKGCQVGYIPFD